MHQSDSDCGADRRLISTASLGTKPQPMSIFLVPCRFRPKCAISASSGTQFLFWRFSIVDCSRPLPTLDLKLGAIDAQGQKRNFARISDTRCWTTFDPFSLVPLFLLFSYIDYISYIYTQATIGHSAIERGCRSQVIGEFGTRPT